MTSGASKATALALARETGIPWHKFIRPDVEIEHAGAST
jgi:hypothetical protein